MRNQLKAIIFGVFILALSTVAGAKPTTIGTINIQSYSTHSLGNVQINLFGGLSVYQYVPGVGTYGVSVSAGPTSVVINGYVTNYGSIGGAVTPDGAFVKVD